MISPTSIENATDSELWTLVCQGSADAFEVILRRYQSLVCAVAYSSCGELAQSEDVAQETFWTAWRGRKSLDQPSKLPSWLCGIARNLGKNARRHGSRPVESAASLDTLAERSTDAPGPVEVAISREEESLIWQTLEQIPETFREPLILFYRENQSVAQVASALELSEAAVKQRLSRGRSMLREHVGELVEEGLRRSRPGRKFSVVVMAGITAGTAGAKTAGAAAAAGAGTKLAMPLAKIAAGAGLSGGLLGGVLGSLGGLFGSWLGVWLPAQLAPTVNERDLIWRTGRRILLASVVFVGVLALLIIMADRGGGRGYLIAIGLWLLTFLTSIMIESIRLARAARQLRQNESSTAEPNPAVLRRGLTALTSRYRGRVWQSQASLFGLPLIDINVSDPGLSPGSCLPNSKGPSHKTARGWIAIGDDARGVVLAIGAIARGFIAVGGSAIGGLSFGGLAVGVVAVGGLAIGGLTFGGVGLGAYVIGGMAIGWQAAGGLAIARDVAVGGLAIADHAAFAGAGTAYARYFALGSQGSAAHFNDDAAKAVLLTHPLKLAMDWTMDHMNWIRVAIFAVAFVPWMAMLPVMYRPKRAT